jgi:hypothetical protein
MWTEETQKGRSEWRGKLERVVNGETLYFHEWSALLAFLHATLDLPVSGGVQPVSSEGPQGGQGEANSYGRSINTSE